MTDPVLLALSDVVVMRALERAHSRTAPRAARQATPSGARWRQYLTRPITDDTIDRALTDAWALLPALANRHHLDVDPTSWQRILDGYTRALLCMAQEHRLDQLGACLRYVEPAADAVVWEETRAAG